MKNVKIVLLICSSLTLMACASTHPGSSGKPVGKQNLPVSVSAQDVPDGGGSNAFQLIQVTIENKSDQWVRVNKSEVLIQDPAKSKLSVVVGNDLVNWAQAVQYKKEVEDYNKALLQSGLALGSAAALAAGARTNNNATATIGAVGIAGVYGWAVTDVISNSRAMAQSARLVPTTHLYEPFAVPPGLFIRRWVLLNKPSDQVLIQLSISFESVEGVRDVYEIPLYTVRE